MDPCVCRLSSWLRISCLTCGLESWLSTSCIRSAVYSKERIGPKTDPCGTPHSTRFTADLAEPHLTYCMQLFRHDVNQRWTGPSRPYDTCSRRNRIDCRLCRTPPTGPIVSTPWDPWCQLPAAYQTELSVPQSRSSGNLSTPIDEWYTQTTGYTDVLGESHWGIWGPHSGLHQWQL